MTKPKLLPLLMLIMGLLLTAGMAVYAVDVEIENLSVDDVWLTGEILHIVVTDNTTGINQELEMNLRDYASAGDEYVTVQAVDRTGNVSNSIQFKNPFYIANSAPHTSDPGESESAVPDGTKPFTPDGTGTVVDNVTDGDGKEFFSISTDDGNIFYLIVDRQRNTDNVYLLNAVTEHDLMSLAKEGDGKGVSAVPEAPSVTPTAPEPTATPEPIPEPPANSGNDYGTLIFIVIAVLAVGGAGYYFKIVRPKQNGGYADDEDVDDVDEDAEYEVNDDGEDGDEE